MFREILTRLAESASDTNEDMQVSDCRGVYGGCVIQSTCTYCSVCAHIQCIQSTELCSGDCADFRMCVGSFA